MRTLVAGHRAPCRATRTSRLLTLLCLILAAGCQRSTDSSEPSTVEAAAFVGVEACSGCHALQTAAWRGSQHAAAMQLAASGAVLADFSSPANAGRDLPARFEREGDEFIVETEGDEGTAQRYRVAYTFGVDPLQQYLLDMGDGRLQAFTIAWDSRAADVGGQRWFDLHPGESIAPDDPLHWTGLLQNWNSNCAECHSTNVEKGYDPEQDRYATSFSSVNVSCEACHGPGSNHAQAPSEHHLALGTIARQWLLSPEARIAHRSPPGTVEARTEIETCAVCHSRRSQLTDAVEPGDPLLDGYRPALLNAPLYHADGQILDEVFVYGSFLQSPMHAAGVTCSDCHEPHSGSLKAEGNALCSQCHVPTAFDTPEHHKHPAGSAASECVACHMPAETYMVVDPRRDHSFRVPRPDLSVRLGVPNACGACHAETAEWAAERVVAWYPDGRTGSSHYAEALAAGRDWSANRSALLTTTVDDSELPPIVRASALELLSQQMDAAAIDSLRAALDSGEPLLELAALDALPSLPEPARIELGQRFLAAPLRGLRIAAATALEGSRSGLSANRQEDLDAAVEEIEAMQRFNADRPEGLIGRAAHERQSGRAAAAEATLLRAIDREPAYVAAYINLADLYRASGQEADAEQTLLRGLEVVPDQAALQHALGLAFVRTGRATEALPMLQRAAESDPAEPRYAYVYGVALNTLATPAEALASLQSTHERFPGHLPTLIALTSMHRDAGNREQALRYARLALEVSPSSPEAEALARQLR